MEGSRSPSLWWRKRLRSFAETTDISEYPHRGREWCAATAPLAPRRASRPPPDRTRYASQCDDVRYATSLGGIKALLTEPPFSAPPPPPPLSPGRQRGQPACYGILCRSRAPVQRDAPPQDATEQTSPTAASARRSGAEHPAGLGENEPDQPHGHLARRYERRHPRRPRDRLPMLQRKSLRRPGGRTTRNRAGHSVRRCAVAQ